MKTEQTIIVYIQCDRWTLYDHHLCYIKIALKAKRNLLCKGQVQLVGSPLSSV